MAGFKKDINLDPTMVAGMNLDQKRECMSEIERRRKTAWKYSCFFCLGLMAYIFAYDLLSVMYSLSEMKIVGQISGFMYLIPIIVMIPSFFAHSMNGKWVVAAVLAYMLSAFVVIITGKWINVIAAPFAIVGAVLYYRLSSCCDMYDVLSKQEGFPDFYSFEHGVAMAKEIIERNNKASGDELSPLTKIAIESHKAAAEKTAQESSEEPKTEEKKEISADDNIGGE
ncbi:MAG: hypothetical protein ACI4SF_15265 [Oscillospiraceae bacterium]